VSVGSTLGDWRSLRDGQHSIPPASLWGSIAIYVGSFLVRDVDIHILRVLPTMYPRASMVRLGEEVILQPPAKLADGGRQPSAPMSIAFLVGDHSKTHCTGLEAVKDCFDMASAPADVPSAHPSLYTLPHDQTEMTRMESKISSSQIDLSHHSHGHLPIQARSVEIVRDIGRLSIGCTSNSGTESCGYVTSNLSSMLSTGLRKP
jgi:hypothetical protein